MHHYPTESAPLAPEQREALAQAFASVIEAEADDATEAPTACECDWHSCTPGCPHARPSPSLAEAQKTWRQRAESRRQGVGYDHLEEFHDALRVRQRSQKMAYLEAQAGGDRDAEALALEELTAATLACDCIASFRLDLAGHVERITRAQLRNAATFLEADGSQRTRRGNPLALAAAERLAALLRAGDAAALLV